MLKFVWILQGGIAAIQSKLRLRVVPLTDKRIGLMNELINSIRLIKMYAWETPFSEMIQDIRKKEMKEMQLAAFVSSLSATVTPSITIVASVATFMALSLGGTELTATKAFTVFSIFTALQFTVATLPYAIRCLAELRVSFQRLQAIFELPEYSHPGHDTDVPQGGIELQGANCFWKQQSQHGSQKENDEQYVQTLFDVNLKVQPGQLIGLAGAVGSGKSSLISAILGEVRKKNRKKKKKICRDPGSNRGPLDLQSNALPTELSRLHERKRNFLPNV